MHDDPTEVGSRRETQKGCFSVTIRRLILSHAVAAGGVVLAGTSHWWLTPLIGDSPPVRLLLVVVVMASASMGGLWTGLFATVLGLLAIVAANDAPGDLASLANRLARFGSLGLLITLLFAGMQAARRRAAIKEDEYRLSEGRYRKLVETAGEGIWALDSDARTIYANPRMGELFGVPPGELIGRNLKEFLAGHAGAPASWSNLVHGSTMCQEVQLLGSDGGVRNAIVSVRPIGRDEVPGCAASPGKGSAGGMLLMVTDVTDLRKAEVALREKETVLRSFYESSVMAMGVIEQTDAEAPVRLGQRSDRQVFRSRSRQGRGDDGLEPARAA